MRRVPGSSVSIGMSCRNFACWLPKIGLLLRIFHAPRTENAPYGYERLGAPSEKGSQWVRKEKQESLDRWWPAVHQSCAQIQRLISFFFATGPPLRLRSRPPDSGFAGGLRRHCRHVIHAHLLGFWKLRSLGRSVDRSVRRSVALGPSFGRSVARSLGRSVAQAFGRAVARSLGSSMKAQVCGLRCTLFRLCFQ